MHSGKKVDGIQQVNQFVMDNFSRKITIQEMADQVHMTRESFCRWFKKETGNTFVDFLNTTRVEMACRLISEKNEPVAAIAYSVGFESASHFNRVFKQKKGLSPRDFRTRTRL